MTDIFKAATLITVTLGAMYAVAMLGVNGVAERIGKINQKKGVER